MTDFIEQDSEHSDQDEPSRVYRGSNADPAFGFLLAIALSVGLIPLLPDHADLRYTLAWGTLASIGILAWLLGSAERIGQEIPENLGWGVLLGVMVSVPFFIFFSRQFGEASRLMFPSLGIGTILAYLVFVMPLAETLFFRGSLQQQQRFWVVGGLSGLWSLVLFFPVMWDVIIQFNGVAIFLAIALLVLNSMYSYVRERNGLAAAWLCQIVVNLILFFVPIITVAS